MDYRKRLANASTITVAILVGSVAFAESGPSVTDIYKAKCASCHGADGSGQTTIGKSMKLRDLRSPEVQKLTDAELLKIIADGKAKMPGYKTKLSVADLSSLVAYVRGMASK